MPPVFDPLQRYQKPIVILGVLLLTLAVRLNQAAVEEQPAVGAWSFDGNLTDRSGRGNEAFAPAPVFVAGHRGQGLACAGEPVVVHDSPELRPAPGLRIDCWAKLDAIGTSYQAIVLKERGYQLRVDPIQEGARFSFFLYQNGWEPRVNSRKAVEIGRWYHLVAGWDGTDLWLEVDGERTSVPRSVAPEPSGEPLELGKFAGVLDELRIANPAAAPAGVAQWLLDGNLRDSSRHGYDLTGEGAEFAAVPGGPALQSGARSVKVASNPNLQLAPGFRIDCAVFFEQVPSNTRQIIMKDGEYQLRLEAAKEGGGFAFFVNLNGWEPRISSEQRVVPGQWYRLTASWDGYTLALEVNGQRSSLPRHGLAKPTDAPLVVGPLGGLVKNLRIENPRRPVLQVDAARQEHAILVAGRTEKFTTILRNIGSPTERVTVRFALPAGVRTGDPATRELGAMATGAQKTIDWSVAADAPAITAAVLQITAAGTAPTTAQHPLVFFPSAEGPPPGTAETLPAPDARGSQATTWYIDSTAGSNTSAGTAPETAWKDFTNINGRCLGPGQRLLLRRGSVWNQELNISACGTAANWAAIGAYGQGARPIIRRNGDINDRCALVSNPNYLRISGLVVCYAAKGLIVHYSEGGHRGLLIDDCIAHHIEGLYRFNAHGIPEWRGSHGPGGDGVSNSPGIAITGGGAARVLRDCEMFQCSSGFLVRGDDVLVDRVYCHDNCVPNTSPHPFLVDVRRAVVRNSLFDAAGWQASAGTMGIMLGDPQGLIIRHCFFCNQPDSGSHDEGGIDFENRGNGCLLEDCTFQNNAGAAIEVLGLKMPQTTNIEIHHCRFIQNNTAHKLGPAEIYVWGQTHDPAICCSTGTVNGNGYVLLPGNEFFVNEAPRLTNWALGANTPYATVPDLERAMPCTPPPTVDAGEDIRTDQRQVMLRGRVSTAGKPTGQPLTSTWEVLEGPGPVRFDAPGAAATSATFETCGDYILRLVADNGQLWRSRTVAVHVQPPGTTWAAAWEFNRNLDKEGWSAVNAGTRIQEWPDPHWSTTAHPVDLVAGGYYVLALEESTDAHLLSADHLGVALGGGAAVILRFQNHTPATQMRLRFTTDTEPGWNDANSRTWSVVANDNTARTYRVDLATIPHSKGRLRQLRLDLATGKPLTGTCRFDYIWICKAGPPG